MLMKFKVENAFGFKKVEFDFFAMDYEKHRGFTKGVGQGGFLCKRGFFYGADGIGKTSLFKAVSWMKQKVFDRGGDICLPNRGHIGSATFEVMFYHLDNTYVYGFQWHGCKGVVEKEWLSRFVEEGQVQVLFERDAQKNVPKYSVTLTNLLITHEVVREWFARLLVVCDEPACHETTLEWDDYREGFNQLWKDLYLPERKLKDQENSVVEGGFFELRTNCIVERHDLFYYLHKRTGGDRLLVLEDSKGDQIRQRSRSRTERDALRWSAALAELGRKTPCVVLIDDFNIHPHMLTWVQKLELGHLNQFFCTTKSLDIMTSTLLRPDEIFFLTEERGGGVGVVSLAEYNHKEAAVRQMGWRKAYLQGRFRLAP